MQPTRIKPTANKVRLDWVFCRNKYSPMMTVTGVKRFNALYTGTEVEDNAVNPQKTFSINAMDNGKSFLAVLILNPEKVIHPLCLSTVSTRIVKRD
jgi:hypothetical protein